MDSFCISQIERKDRVEQEPNNRPSMRSEAIAVIVSAIVGSGIGWALWLASSNIAVAIGMAGPMAALTNNFLRKVIK
jgi:uncharacterized membrane protein